MVQVQTFAWPDGPATADLVPTRDLIAVPPVFEIAGNGRQIIRVALRAPLPGPREHAFRLLITEVPRGGAATTGVRFALRLSLPVFVIPDGARPEPQWSLRGRGSGQLDLVLRNVGDAHLQVRRITWRPEGRAGPATGIEAPAYVLAGREHSWPLPGGAVAGPIELQAETSLGTAACDRRPAARLGPRWRRCCSPRRHRRRHSPNRRPASARHPPSRSCPRWDRRAATRCCHRFMSRRAGTSCCWRSS